jgi:hypothetical protein
MSELINNREDRQRKLKEMIMQLHEGATVEEVREQFAELISGVEASEITEMEQALVNEGMPVEEIQRLCDVHASVFKGSIEEIHAIEETEELGHPLNTFMLENREIESVIKSEILPTLELVKKNQEPNKIEILKMAWMKFSTIDRHYARKENLVFPYMEKYKMTAPPQVMWGVDDEVREGIKKIRELLENQVDDWGVVEELILETTEKALEMIFKEENILFPMIIEKMSLDEWKVVEESSAEIGFTLLKVVDRWKPQHDEKIESKGEVKSSNDKHIQFDAGSLTSEELNSILNTIPFDMTFVGVDDRVKYFTQGKQRIFDRSKTIIGRQVKYCHPPKSVHIVEEIVKDLKSGKKDHEEFWIRLGDMFVHIRYYAVRSKTGDYLGTLEVSQNIKPITELEGEKRLVAEEE